MFLASKLVYSVNLATPHVQDLYIALYVYVHVKVLRRKVALEIHRSKIFLWAYPAELINADSTSQANKANTS